MIFLQRGRDSSEQLADGGVILGSALLGQESKHLGGAALGSPRPLVGGQAKPGTCGGMSGGEG